MTSRFLFSDVNCPAVRSRGRPTTRRPGLLLLSSATEDQNQIPRDMKQTTHRRDKPVQILQEPSHLGRREKERLRVLLRTNLKDTSISLFFPVILTQLNTPYNDRVQKASIALASTSSASQLIPSPPLRMAATSLSTPSGMSLPSCAAAFLISASPSASVTK